MAALNNVSQNSVFWVVSPKNKTMSAWDQWNQQSISPVLYIFLIFKVLKLAVLHKKKRYKVKAKVQFISGK